MDSRRGWWESGKEGKKGRGCRQLASTVWCQSWSSARVSLGKYALGYGKSRLKAHPALPGAHPPGAIRWGMSSPCLAGGLWCTWYAWEPCPPRVSTSALLFQWNLFSWNQKSVLPNWPSVAGLDPGARRYLGACWGLSPSLTSRLSRTKISA